MERSSRIDFFYHLIYQLPLALLFVIYYTRYLIPEDSISSPLIICFFFSLILPLYRILKTKGQLILSGLILEVLIVMILLRPEGERMTFFTDNTALWGILFLTLFTFFLVMVMNKWLPVKMLTGIASVVLLLLCLFYDQQVTYLQTGLTLFLTALCLSELVQRFWKKQGDRDQKKHLVFVAPFILLTFMFLFTLKVPEKPYDWHFFRKIYASVAGVFDRISIAVFTGFGDSYENQVVGFSEGGFIPGSVKNAPRDVLEIRFDKSGNRQIYLTGKIFNEFYGKEWKSTSDSPVNSGMMDALETYACVKAYDDNYLSDYVRRTAINIAYRHFRSRTIFSPLKSLISPTTFEDIRYYYSGGNLRSDILISYRDAYDLSYYRVNQEAELFSEMEKARPYISPDIWHSALVAFDLENSEEFSYESYGSYRQEMFSTYLSDMDLTDRTADFLDDLLKNCESDLDKLKMLEQVFQDYVYDQDPGSIPEDVDSPGKYLDYFLFENPKGFCSHYATAFVLLSRASGIPARYCQGYYVPYNKEEVVKVSSGMAHAWPEAYIEGIGWLRFEPTPGYKVYTGWAVTDRDPKDHSDDPIPLRPDIPESVIPDAEQEEQMPEDDTGIDPLRIYLLIAVLLILSLLVFLLFEIIHIRNRYNRADNNEKVRIMFRRNMNLLRFMDVSGIREGETLSEYRTRAEKYIEPENLHFIGNYEEVIYGSRPASDDICRDSEHANALLKKVLKKDKPYSYLFFLLRSYL